MKYGHPHDGELFIDARGWQLVYNAVKIAWLWLNRSRRAGHWYFGEWKDNDGH